MAKTPIHEPSVKRRKVRKGTQSCWECRRRKVRCIFTRIDVDNPVCDNCVRRNTPCVSQEFETSSEIEAQERTGNVEVSPETFSFHEGSQQSNSVYADSDATVDNINKSLYELRSDTMVHSRNHTSRPNKSSSAVTPRFERLNRELIAAWPSQPELDIVCALPVGLSSHLHTGFIARPLTNSNENRPSPKDILQLPPRGSHPILFARTLLVLGTFLQGVVPSASQRLLAQGFRLHDTMNRVIETAINHVTTKDDLILSVEGLESVFMETLYHNYAGNIHRAWMAIRRAISIAQMMALHRGFESPSIKVLDPKTRSVVNLEYLAFRLAQMDGYLSLMLGLPPASFDISHVTSPRALDLCNPIERLQRMHHMIYEHVLQRTDVSINDFNETRALDKSIRDIAAGVSPQWWTMPIFGQNYSEAEIMDDMLRTMTHFSHYHLIIRLHLPYLLRFGTDNRCNYSKVTAATASRELLIRYIAFRTTNQANYYCRGSDFLAFIAATVLCIVHLNQHRSINAIEDETGSGLMLDTLAHSRQTDRGIMYSVLEILEKMARSSSYLTSQDATKDDGDAIALRLSRILRPLLHIENSSCARYSATREGVSEYEGRLMDGNIEVQGDDEAINVHIPYFGCVRFAKGGVLRVDDRARDGSHVRDGDLGADITTEESSWQHGKNDTFAPSLDVLGFGGPEHCLSASQLGDDILWANGLNWDVQGVDGALFEGLFGF